MADSGLGNSGYLSEDTHSDGSKPSQVSAENLTNQDAGFVSSHVTGEYDGKSLLENKYLPDGQSLYSSKPVSRQSSVYTLSQNAAAKVRRILQVIIHTQCFY